MSTKAKKSKSTTSSWQQKFQTQNTFKRNKRYLDVDLIKNVQENYTVNRRKPFSNQNNCVSNKINRSFLNSTEVVVSKLDSQITKFKQRINSVHQNNSPEFIELNWSMSARTNRNIYMNRDLPREYFYHKKHNNNIDQRLFNNYVLEKPNYSNTIDFNNMAVKSIEGNENQIQNIEYKNIQNLYQKFYYKTNIKNFQFSYRDERTKKSSREYFKKRRKDDDPTTDLSPTTVQKAQKTTSVNRPCTANCFYNDAAKQLPCQLDMRKNTPLTDYYHQKDGNIQRPKLQYNIRRYKQDLKIERKTTIRKKKQPKFKRSDLCDLKYFRVTKQI